MKALKFFNFILTFLLKLFRNRKINSQKLEIRRRKFLESKAKVHELYPNVTEHQYRIVALDVPELLQEVREGQLKAVDVFEALTAKAVEADLRTNCVVEFLLQDGLERAKALDDLEPSSRRPLHGLPFSIKEHIAVKGRDSTLGCVSRIGLYEDEDAEFVKLMLDLGAIPLCRTNLSQAIKSFGCSNPIFGVTANPLDVNRTPGGSSGGEAALIASGASLVGFGSDFGGSVRTPATFCGIASLKPTRGKKYLNAELKRFRWQHFL